MIMKQAGKKVFPSFSPINVESKESNSLKSLDLSIENNSKEEIPIQKKPTQFTELVTQDEDEGGTGGDTPFDNGYCTNPCCCCVKSLEKSVQIVIILQLVNKYINQCIISATRIHDY